MSDFPPLAVSRARPPALAPSEIARLGLLLFQGAPVHVRALSQHDAGAVFAVAMRHLVGAWELKKSAAAMREGREYHRPTRRPLASGPGQPSEIMGELLSSPEAALYLSVLAALVTVAVRLPSVAGEGVHYLGNGLSRERRALCSLIRRKLDLPSVTGEDALAALEPDVVAWVNALSPSEADYWSDHGRVRKHHGEIAEAGRAIRRTWGPPLARLGIRLDDVDTSSRFLALPTHDPERWAAPDPALTAHLASRPEDAR